MRNSKAELVLINNSGEVLLKGRNTIKTDNDCLAHAEINLIREACKIYDFQLLMNVRFILAMNPALCALLLFIGVALENLSMA